MQIDDVWCPGCDGGCDSCRGIPAEITGPQEAAPPLITDDALTRLDELAQAANGQWRDGEKAAFHDAADPPTIRALIADVRQGNEVFVDVMKQLQAAEARVKDLEDAYQLEMDARAELQSRLERREARVKEWEASLQCAEEDVRQGLVKLEDAWDQIRALEAQGRKMAAAQGVSGRLISEQAAQIREARQLLRLVPSNVALDCPDKWINAVRAFLAATAEGAGEEAGDG